MALGKRLGHGRGLDIRPVMTGCEIENWASRRIASVLLDFALANRACSDTEMPLLNVVLLIRSK